MLDQKALEKFEKDKNAIKCLLNTKHGVFNVLIWVLELFSILDNVILGNICRQTKKLFGPLQILRKKPN